MGKLIKISLFSSCILGLLVIIFFLMASRPTRSRKDASTRALEKIASIDHFLSTNQGMSPKESERIFNSSFLEEKIRGEYAIYGLKNVSIVWELLKINRDEWFVKSRDYNIWVAFKDTGTRSNWECVRLCILLPREPMKPESNTHGEYIGFALNGKIDLFMDIPKTASIAAKVGLDQDGTFVQKEKEYMFLTHLLKMNPVLVDNKVLSRRFLELHESRSHD